MTREEKIKAFTMKLDGATYQQIANEFGVTKQCIQQMLIGGKRRNTWSIEQKGFIYPNLVNYMVRNNLHTVTAFKTHTGLNVAIHDLIRRLQGNTPFKIDDIQKILSATGMSYEEAFQVRGGC